MTRCLALIALVLVTACGSDRTQTRSAELGSGDQCEATCPPGTTRTVDDLGNVSCQPDEPPECAVDADCGEGAHCIEGCCVAPDDCHADSDCQSGQRCVEGSCVVDTCATNDDCPSGEICSDGTCTAGNCIEDSDCPSGWHCAEGGPFLPGVCVQDGPCDQTSCPSGFVCVNGACTEQPIPCQDCPTGLCVDGVCQPCRAPASCHDGECEPSMCTIDAGVDPPADAPEYGADAPIDAAANPVDAHADAGHDASSPEYGSEYGTEIGTDEDPHEYGGGDTRRKRPAAIARSRTYLSGYRKKSCKHKVGEPDPPKDGKKYSGLLTVWAIRTASDLWWGSPNQLAASTVVAYGAAQVLVWTNQAVLGHPIGHLQVEMSCTSDDATHTITIPLTGQTGGGSELLASFEGAGSLFHEFPGWLDHRGPKYADIKRDFTTRKQSGRIAGMKFKLNDALCRHMWGYFNWYDTSDGPKHYGGQFRPQRKEGSGCTAFGTSFVDRGGFLPRDFMVDTWARQEFIGVNHVGKVLPPRSHPYGSNLVAWNNQGFQMWPKGQVVPAVAPIIPFSPILNTWSDPMENEVPFTLFDAELVYKWIHSVWNNVNKGGVDPLWKIDNDPANGKAKVIISDFSCDKRNKLPPYPDPEDDLRK